MNSQRVTSGEIFGSAERRSRILLVEDDQGSRDVLVAILRRAGLMNVQPEETAAGAFRAFANRLPDLAIVDLHLPDGSGLNLISELRAALGPDEYLPILVLTGDSTVEARDAAFSMGATDFVTKPYRTNEVLLRIHNLLESRHMHVELHRQRGLLQEGFDHRTRELEDARLEVLERLARVAEQRDDGAVGHIRRVGELAGMIAREVGCPDDIAEQISRAAPLHDVGKIGVRDDILLKPGALDTAEYEAQQKHTLIGAHILGGGGFAVLKMAEEIALTHHERWDGAGYPYGIKGEAIPIAGRIVAVADTFDALLHRRPYKPAWPLEVVMGEIQRGSSQRFDPQVVEGLVRLFERGELTRFLPAAASNAEIRVA
jgi:putative two-component system response regulator